MTADRFKLTLAESVEIQGDGRLTEKEQLEAMDDFQALHVSVCSHIQSRLALLARHAGSPFPAAA
jgi:hypothetical protein